MNLWCRWFLLFSSLILPSQLLAFSGMARRSRAHVQQNHWLLSRDDLLLTRDADCNSRQTLGHCEFPTALEASTVPPIGLVRHIGMLSVAALVVKGLKRILFANDDQPKVGIMERCPWPFIFFHDPKQGFKDPSTWTTLLYIAIWRFVKAYQAFKLS